MTRKTVTCAYISVKRVFILREVSKCFTPLKKNDLTTYFKFPQQIIKIFIVINYIKYQQIRD